MYGDYATTAMMTGDIVCGLESTASILYYKDAVTYPDNTHEPLELVALPFPAFAGKEKTVMQRGVGLGAVRTTQTAAAAAAVFLEWITETETNLEFVTAGGYLPVRREAFEALLNGAHGTLADVRAESLYEAITTLYRDYSFYTPPLFERYGALQKRFDSAALEALSAARGMEGSASAGTLALVRAACEE